MKILLVDDDTVSRMALVDLMSRFEGLELVEAEDGMHAWELIDRGMTPGAILSDLHMPRLTGIELLRKVRNKGGLGDLPFVLVTSSADLGTVKQAMTLGIDHYIVKPFNAEATEKSICRTITNAWNNNAEAPESTLKRLRIANERLALYLGSLTTQVKQLHDDVDDLPSAGALWARLDTVKTGCLTLGLWHGARIARRIREESALNFDRGRVASELREIIERVDAQKACI
jgi:two-component system chemotaxis response regulator CheY